MGAGALEAWRGRAEAPIACLPPGSWRPKRRSRRRRGGRFGRRRVRGVGGPLLDGLYARAQLSAGRGERVRGLGDGRPSGGRCDVPLRDEQLRRAVRHAAASRRGGAKDGDPEHALLHRRRGRHAHGRVPRAVGDPCEFQGRFKVGQSAPVPQLALRWVDAGLGGQVFARMRRLGGPRHGLRGPQRRAPRLPRLRGAAAESAKPAKPAKPAESAKPAGSADGRRSLLRARRRRRRRHRRESAAGPACAPGPRRGSLCLAGGDGAKTAAPGPPRAPKRRRQ
mmetsp:Transcript_67123/g.151783  ORF Transcript_67123/g.151783 Transcript_67123/m.151783 type:complete len:280 (+) Transcript_67123:505-1344(+)